MRGRPQGGRAVISNVDFDSGDGCSSSSIVNSSSFVEIRTLTPTLTELLAF